MSTLTLIATAPTLGFLTGAGAGVGTGRPRVQRDAPVMMDVMSTPSPGPALGEGASGDTDGLGALVAATAAGDEAAFECLYDRISPRVHGLVLRVVRDPAQAEEVTQEVFLELWRNARHIDLAHGSPMGWILALAHRRAVDRVRSAEAARRRDHLDLVRDPRRSRDETVEQAHANLDSDRVQQALTGLTDLQRQAIQLAYFDGYTHTQVAALLGIPLGTAKSRIRDALLRLRDVLGENS